MLRGRSHEKSSAREDNIKKEAYRAKDILLYIFILRYEVQLNIFHAHNKSSSALAMFKMW